MARCAMKPDLVSPCCFAFASKRASTRLGSVRFTRSILPAYRSFEQVLWQVLFLGVERFNVLAHGYDTVHLGVVWNTIEVDFPNLKTLVEKGIEDLFAVTRIKRISEKNRVRQYNNGTPTHLGSGRAYWRRDPNPSDLPPSDLLLPARPLPSLCSQYRSDVHPD